jgi:hypothetical protein
MMVTKPENSTNHVADVSVHHQSQIIKDKLGKALGLNGREDKCSMLM